MPYEIGSGGSFVDRLYLERLAGIVPLLAVIVFTWLLAGELLGGALWVRTLAAGSVALLPQLSHMSGVVNPDVFLAAIWAAFLYVAVITLKRGLTWPRLALGRGLSPSSRRADAGARRGDRRARPADGRAGRTPPRSPAGAASPSRRAAFLGVCGAVALAVLAFTPALDSRAVQAPGRQVLRDPRFVNYVWQFYLPTLPFMDPSIAPPAPGRSRSCWSIFSGAFAWQEVLFPRGSTTSLRILAIGGLRGLAVALVVRRVEVPRRWDVLVVLVVALVAPILGLHVTEFLSYITNSLGAVITGRYLLPLARAGGRPALPCGGDGHHRHDDLPAEAGQEGRRTDRARPGPAAALAVNAGRPFPRLDGTLAGSHAPPRWGSGGEAACAPTRLAGRRFLAVRTTRCAT